MAKTAVAENTEAGDSAPPKKSKRMLIIGVAAVLLLGGGGGGYYYWQAQNHKAAAADTTTVQRQASYVELRDVVVSLAPAPGRTQEAPRILKLKLVLEVANPRIVPEIQQLQPRIEDIMQIYLRELRVSDIEGSAGLYRLKEELLRRVNSAVYPRRVDAVLFKDIMMQ